MSSFEHQLLLSQDRLKDHHKQIPSVQNAFIRDVDDLVSAFEEAGNPFEDDGECLFAFDTKDIVELKINRKKTELMKMNTTANAPITVGGEPIREVESFVYLGSVVDHQGGTDRDVTARIGKARTAFVMLKNIWASEGISMRTKLRISIPVCSQSCFTDVRHSRQHRRCNERSRHSSTPV